MTGAIAEQLFGSLPERVEINGTWASWDYSHLRYDARETHLSQHSGRSSRGHRRQPYTVGELKRAAVDQTTQRSCTPISTRQAERNWPPFFPSALIQRLAFFGSRE
jgi:hypothetical protein